MSKSKTCFEIRVKKVNDRQDKTDDIKIRVDPMRLRR